MIRNAKANAIANILARVWGATAAFAFLPIYLHVLGPEAFGLVALFTTLQVTLTVAFTGWTKVLRREFALEEGSHPAGGGRRATLASFQLVYGGGAILIFVVGSLLGIVLSRHWLQYHSLTQGEVSGAITLMSASIGALLLAQSFQSALHGMQHQVSAAIAEVSWSLMRGITAALVAITQDNSVIAFFAAFLVCDAIYAFCLRAGLAFALRHSVVEPWSFRDVKRLRRLTPLSSALTIIAIAYLCNTQIDRIFISRMVGLDALGVYNIAAALGLLPVTAATGLAVTAFPIFVRAFSTGDMGALRSYFRVFSLLVILLATCMATFLIVYRVELLTFWIRDASSVAQASVPAIGLIVGGYFLALQQIPYEYLLARGVSRINVIMSLWCTPWSLIVTPLAVYFGGLPGASLSWGVLMGVTTLGYLALVLHRYFDIGPLVGLGRTVALPFIVFGGVALASRLLLQVIGVSGVAMLGLGVIVGALTLATALVACFRNEVVERLRGRTGNV